MTIWNVKGQCGDCGFVYKGHVAATADRFPGLTCPGCGKPIQKGVRKTRLEGLTRNSAAVYTRLLAARIQQYANPFSIQVLYPDLRHRAGSSEPSLDIFASLARHPNGSDAD